MVQRTEPQEVLAFSDTACFERERFKSRIEGGRLACLTRFKFLNREIDGRSLISRCIVGRAPSIDPAKILETVQGTLWYLRRHTGRAERATFGWNGFALL